MDFTCGFWGMYSLCFLAIAICSLSALTHALLLARRLYPQGVLHVRFLRVVMAWVFDPLLPVVCFHASCHRLFLDPIVSFLLYFIDLFLELLYYFHYYLRLRVFWGLKFLAYHTLTLALSYIFVRLTSPELVGWSSSSQLMAQLFIMLEWPLDPFFGERKWSQA